MSNANAGATIAKYAIKNETCRTLFNVDFGMVLHALLLVTFVRYEPTGNNICSLKQSFSVNSLVL